jgi:hypothetical protein
MTTLILVYVYTLTVIITLDGLCVWAIVKGEIALLRALASGAILLSALAAAGLVGLPFNDVKAVLLVVVLPFGFASVAFALSAFIRAPKNNR